jgi:hypothetical protein
MTAVSVLQARRIWSYPLQLAAGTVFLLAVWGKLESPEVFRNALTALGMPSWLQTGFVPILLALEFTVGASLAINYHPRLAWKLACGLACSFLATQAYGFLWKGMTDCNCFGLLLRLTPLQSVLLDAALLAASAWAIGLPKSGAADLKDQRTAVERRRLRQAAIDLLCVAGIAVTAISVVPRLVLRHTAGPVVSPHPVYHFGLVREGDTIRHTFELLNTSADRIRIASVDHSCSCTQARVASEYVSPLGRNQVRVEARPSVIGPFQDAVQVVLDTPRGSQKVTLLLVGTVLRS